MSDQKGKGRALGGRRLDVLPVRWAGRDVPPLERDGWCPAVGRFGHRCELPEGHEHEHESYSDPGGWIGWIETEQEVLDLATELVSTLDRLLKHPNAPTWDRYPNTGCNRLSACR